MKVSFAIDTENGTYTFSIKPVPKSIDSEEVCAALWSAVNSVCRDLTEKYQGSLVISTEGGSKYQEVS